MLWSYGSELAVDGDPNTCSFTSRQEGQRWWRVSLDTTPSNILHCSLQVQLSSHPVVAAVWVTMSPGAYQKFAIFVVEILDGNTAEYKPCNKFEGRFHEQLVQFECNEGAGQLGQFVYIRDDRADREYFGLCEVQVFPLSPRPECGQPEAPVYSQVRSVLLYYCRTALRCRWAWWGAWRATAAARATPGWVRPPGTAPGGAGRDPSPSVRVSTQPSPVQDISSRDTFSLLKYCRPSSIHAGVGRYCNSVRR